MYKMAQTAILAVFPHNLSYLYIWSISMPSHYDMDAACFFVRNCHKTKFFH